MSKSRARKFADMFRTSLATVLEGNELGKDDVTGLTEIETKANAADTKAAENEQAISALHAVSTSGDYNDLINKPSLDHADTSAQVSVNNSGNTVIQDVTLDTYGHITGINSTTIFTGYPTRAWAHFTAYSSFSLQGNGNVSSVTDNGTGNFRVNFSSSMSSATYAGIATAGHDGTSYGDANNNIDHLAVMGQMNTSNLYVGCADIDDGATDDPQYMGVTVTL